MLGCAGPETAPAVSPKLHSTVIIRLPQSSPERQFLQTTFTGRLRAQTVMLSKRIFQTLVTERSLDLSSGAVCRGNAGVLLYCTGCSSQEQGEIISPPTASRTGRSSLNTHSCASVQCFWLCATTMYHQNLSELTLLTGPRKY